MRRETFQTSGGISCELITGSGDVEVVSAGDGDLVVELRGGPEQDFVVEFDGTSLVVRPPTQRSGKTRFTPTDIRIAVPEGASIRVRTASGDVLVATDVDSFSVATASGDVRASGRIGGNADAKTASGELRLGDVDGDLYVASASGDTVAESVGGECRISSVSGDFRAAAVEGGLEAKSVSGTVAVEAVAGQLARVRTLSGDVRFGIPAGRSVDLDLETLSGNLINRLRAPAEPSAAPKPLAIQVKTVSGDLRLENA